MRTSTLIRSPLTRSWRLCTSSGNVQINCFVRFNGLSNVKVILDTLPAGFAHRRCLGAMRQQAKAFFLPSAPATAAYENPVLPSTTTSGFPPTAVATTGSREAIASSNAIDMPSVFELNMKSRASCKPLRERPSGCLRIERSFRTPDVMLTSDSS